MNDSGNFDHDHPGRKSAKNERLKAEELVVGNPLGDISNEAHEKKFQAFLADKPYIAASMRLNHDAQSFLAMMEEGTRVENGMPETVRQTLPDLSTQTLTDFNKHEALNNDLSESEKMAAVKQLLFIGYNMDNIGNMLQYGSVVIPQIIEAYKQRGILNQEVYEKNKGEIDDLIVLTMQSGIRKALERTSVSPSPSPHQELTNSRIQEIVNSLKGNDIIKYMGPSENGMVSTMRPSLEKFPTGVSAHSDQVETKTPAVINGPATRETTSDLPDNIPDGLSDPMRKSLGLDPKPHDDDSGNTGILSSKQK